MGSGWCRCSAAYVASSFANVAQPTQPSCWAAEEIAKRKLEEKFPVLQKCNDATYCWPELDEKMTCNVWWPIGKPCVYWLTFRCNIGDVSMTFRCNVGDVMTKSRDRSSCHLLYAKVPFLCSYFSVCRFVELGNSLSAMGQFVQRGPAVFEWDSLFKETQ